MTRPFRARLVAVSAAALVLVTLACQGRRQAPPPGQGIDLAGTGPPERLPFKSLDPAVLKVFDPGQPGVEGLPCAVMDKRFPNAEKLVEHIETLDDAVFEHGLLLVRENRVRPPEESAVFARLRAFAVEHDVDLFVLPPEAEKDGSGDFVWWYVRSTRSPYMGDSE